MASTDDRQEPTVAGLESRVLRHADFARSFAIGGRIQSFADRRMTRIQPTRFALLSRPSLGSRKLAVEVGLRYLPLAADLGFRPWLGRASGDLYPVTWVNRLSADLLRLFEDEAEIFAEAAQSASFAEAIRRPSRAVAAQHPSRRPSLERARRIAARQKPVARAAARVAAMTNWVEKIAPGLATPLRAVAERQAFSLVSSDAIERAWVALAETGLDSGSASDLEKTEGPRALGTIDSSAMSQPALLASARRMSPTLASLPASAAPTDLHGGTRDPRTGAVARPWMTETDSVSGETVRLPRLSRAVVQGARSPYPISMGRIGTFSTMISARPSMGLPTEIMTSSGSEGTRRPLTVRIEPDLARSPSLMVGETASSTLVQQRAALEPVRLARLMRSGWDEAAPGEPRDRASTETTAPSVQTGRFEKPWVRTPAALLDDVAIDPRYLPSLSESLTSVARQTSRTASAVRMITGPQHPATALLSRIDGRTSGRMLHRKASDAFDQRQETLRQLTVPEAASAAVMLSLPTLRQDSVIGGGLSGYDNDPGAPHSQTQIALQIARGGAHPSSAIGPRAPRVLMRAPAGLPGTVARPASLGDAEGGEAKGIEHGVVPMTREISSTTSSAALPDLSVVHLAPAGLVDSTTGRAVQRTGKRADRAWEMFSPAKALSLALLMGSATDDGVSTPDIVAKTSRRAGRAARLGVVLTEGRSSLADMLAFSQSEPAPRKLVPTAFGTLEIERLAGKTRALRLDPIPTATFVQIVKEDESPLDHMMNDLGSGALAGKQAPFRVSTPAVARAMVDVATPTPTLAEVFAAERAQSSGTPVTAVSVGGTTSVPLALRPPREVIRSIPVESAVSSISGEDPSTKGESASLRTVGVSPSMAAMLQLKTRTASTPKLDLTAFVSEVRAAAERRMPPMLGRSAIERTVTMGMTLAPRDVVALGKVEPPAARSQDIFQLAPTQLRSEPSIGTEHPRPVRRQDLWPVAAASLDKILIAPKELIASPVEERLLKTIAARTAPARVELSRLVGGLIQPAQTVETRAQTGIERISTLAAIQPTTSSLGARPTASAMVAARKDLVRLATQAPFVDTASSAARLELPRQDRPPRSGVAMHVSLPSISVPGEIAALSPEAVSSSMDAMAWASDILKESKEVAFRATTEVRASGKMSRPTEESVRRMFTLADEVGAAVPAGRTLQKELLPLLVRIEQASLQAQHIARDLGLAVESAQGERASAVMRKPHRTLRLPEQSVERSVVGVSDYHSELSGTVSHLSGPTVSTVPLPATSSDAVGRARMVRPVDSYRSDGAEGGEARGTVGRPSFAGKAVRLLKPFGAVFSPSTGQARLLSRAAKELFVGAERGTQLQFVSAGQLGFGPPREDPSPLEVHARRITERVAGRFTEGLAPLAPQRAADLQTDHVGPAPGPEIPKQEVLRELASKGHSVTQLQQALRQASLRPKAAGIKHVESPRTVSSLVARILADVKPQGVMKASAMAIALSSLNLGVTSLVSAATDPGVQPSISSVRLEPGALGADSPQPATQGQQTRDLAGMAAAERGLVSVSEFSPQPGQEGPVSRSATAAARTSPGTQAVVGQRERSPRARSVASVLDYRRSALGSLEKRGGEASTLDFEWLEREISSIVGLDRQLGLGAHVSRVGRLPAVAAAERVIRQLDQAATRAETTIQQGQHGDVGQVVTLSSDVRPARARIRRAETGLGSSAPERRVLQGMAVQGEPVVTGRQYVEPWRAAVTAPESTISPLARVSAQSSGQEGDRSDTAGSMASPPQDKLKQMAEDIFGIIKDRLDEEAARFGR